MSDGLKDQIAAIEDKIKNIDSSYSSEISTSWWSTQDAMTISSITLGFGILSFIIIGYLFRKENDSDALLRALGTVIVVFAALFLVVAGYSDSQVAPAFGLLGTVAGYIFGKSNASKN